MPVPTVMDSVVLGFPERKQNCYSLFKVILYCLDTSASIPWNSIESPTSYSFKHVSYSDRVFVPLNVNIAGVS